MIIQEYPIIERAVVSGVSAGVEALLKDVSNFSKPEVVVNTISQYVINELCEVVDFGQHNLRFTTDLMRKLYQQAQLEDQLAELDKTPTPL